MFPSMARVAAGVADLGPFTFFNEIFNGTTTQVFIANDTWNQAGGGQSGARGAGAKTSGKHYYELNITSNTHLNTGLGSNDDQWSLDGLPPAGESLNGGQTGLPAFTGLHAVACDVDAGEMWININGDYYNGAGNIDPLGDPATGTNPTYTFTPNRLTLPALGARDNTVMTIIGDPANYTLQALPTGFAGWTEVDD